MNWSSSTYVPTDPGLRRVQHQEQMVVVAMKLGHLIPIRRVPNREGMEPKGRFDRLLGLLVPHRTSTQTSPSVWASSLATYDGR